MSITVNYKGQDIAQSAGNALTLLTAGKYMEADVLLSASGGGSAWDFESDAKSGVNQSLSSRLDIDGFKPTKPCIIIVDADDYDGNNYYIVRTVITVFDAGDTTNAAQVANYLANGTNTSGYSGNGASFTFNEAKTYVNYKLNINNDGIQTALYRGFKPNVNLHIRAKYI